MQVKQHEVESVYRVDRIVPKSSRVESSRPIRVESVDRVESANVEMV